MSNLPISLHILSEMNDVAKASLLVRTEGDLSSYLEKVQPIIDEVKNTGDHALVKYASLFDRADISIDEIEASSDDFTFANNSLDSNFIETLEYAAHNIRSFHEEQLPREMWTKEIRPGVIVGERYSAIDSAALYSPRGKGSFPSVTLMTAIPAIVAGVNEAIVVTPPGPDGNIDPATLVAAKIAGVERVFKVGGAVAVAACAFGTQSIPKCQVIEGPGSPWLVAAKRILSGEISSVVRAGPTESMIFADESADPYKTALDLLIEAEHGPDSSVFLITTSEQLAWEVQKFIPGFLKKMDHKRAEYATTVLTGDNGGIILSQSSNEAYDFINDYAPEHLQIMSKQPFDHLSYIRNASEVLLGEYLPSSIANYVMGANAVLPTSGAAKFCSPLGVHNFMKSASIAHISPIGYREMSRHTEQFARYEGFDAHANAVSHLRECVTKV